MRIGISNFYRALALFMASSIVAILPTLSFAEIEEITVTANKVEQNIQDVSVSVTALDEVAIERAGIIDITGLETLVPGLRIGISGSEVRPSLRGARTNDVGVAGPGIAEQVVGIFQDGVYSPTTTAGLGAYVDIKRIEVLRGPQGTLYGRNTFAGSINVISNTPDFDEAGGSLKVLRGDYNRDSYEAVLNLPVSDSFATRFVMSADKHDGIINNLHLDGTADDLRDRDRYYLRSTSQWQADELTATLRIDYSKKDQAADAIWGYQQIAGYSLTRGVGYAPANRVYEPNATVTPGHIYAGTVPAPTAADPDATRPIRQDPGPYNVYRNGVFWDRQETHSITFALDWSGLEFADTKFTFNRSELRGSQYYDSDYSENGNNLNGFGRRDNQETLSFELQLTSNNDGPLSWIGGLYRFDQEADWHWLFDADNGTRIGACCGTLNNNDPHTADSLAIYGQATYALNDSLRVIGGLRFNDDEKEFTGNIADWDDSSVLWKLAIEKDLFDDTLAYASISTGVRTGGANDTRTRAAGAPETYDNEEVTSFELGLKNTLFDNTMTLNLSVFANTYEDVKAQLFAVACTNGQRTVAQCEDNIDATLPGAVSTLRTFEYSENGGDVDSYGLELEALWSPTDEALVNFNVAYLNSEFDGGYAVGNAQLRPLLGLGNYQGRQDVNDPNSQFDFSGWAPALSPEWTVGLGGAYDIPMNLGKLGRAVMTPSAQLRWVDDYYAFDVNIPEVEQESHVIGDFRLSWLFEENDIQLAAFVKNAFDETVLTRAVVHSQILNGDPINSVQANYNTPRTWGVSIKYTF